MNRFLIAHTATKTVYVVEAEHKIVTPPLKTDIGEFWFVAVCWNHLQEFGQGHWGRFYAEFTPMFKAEKTVPTWRFMAYDAPQQWSYSTSKEDGCPMQRCEWVEEFLRRYKCH